MRYENSYRKGAGRRYFRRHDGFFRFQDSDVSSIMPRVSRRDFVVA